MNNKNQIEQPPTYMPPPQHYLPPPQQPGYSNVAHDQTNAKTTGRKFQIAFFASIAFAIISNVVTYRVVNQLFLAFTGKTNEVMSEAGFPTTKGIFLHTCIFFVVMMVLMQKL